MERPSYLSKYLFDWEAMDMVLGGKSALDAKFFLGPIVAENQAKNFLQGYGLDYGGPVTRAELFGNFQEALQFVRRYFLKEGNEDGLDLEIPESILKIKDINGLFIMMVKNKLDIDLEEILWAEAILKVMHTILHIDKDLYFHYFKAIQTQIFDRFYKYVYRDEEQNLFLGIKSENMAIPLVDFEAKTKKGRDSIIIKLLHKAENVAEELFDLVGVRIVTESRFDTLRALKFLIDEFIVIPHNIKPSRSVNTIFDLEHFRREYKKAVKMALKGGFSEEDFLKVLERGMTYTQSLEGNNFHTLKNYRSLQFTCRQLIKYTNPFF